MYYSLLHLYIFDNNKNKTSQEVKELSGVEQLMPEVGSR